MYPNTRITDDIAVPSSMRQCMIYVGPFQLPMMNTHLGSAVWLGGHWQPGQPLSVSRGFGVTDTAATEVPPAAPLSAL